MEITGNQIIAAPRQAVWDALNDPAVLKRCLPGCEKVEQLGEDEFKIIITAAIGPLRARFNGKLNVTQANPPASCIMVFEGQGGAMGFGSGTASVTLEEENGETHLRYEAKAQVGGKLAQVGSRLIDTVAKKVADDFFKAFYQCFVPVKEEERPVAPTGEKAAEPLRRETVAAKPTDPFKEAPVGSYPAWWLLVSFMLGVGATLLGAVVI
ncbi:MAG: carbon monoxide dehydrogenase subunit G [Pigmentiphaga sp.]|nr:carbon monoxide dehydrogenase subunit G [Pigmentiphaga sp.]